MRGPASLAYLLARTSDTLADTDTAPAVVRIECLQRFTHAITNPGTPPQWPLQLIHALTKPHERLLMERSDALLRWLDQIPPEVAILIRDVVNTITSGQMLDLQRFAAASGSHPVTLENDAALEDYAWRVAGCVGVFWTKLGFLTMRDRFSTTPENQLLELGASFGKGLQLVNILRDVAADLATGRCYLPLADPHDKREWLESHLRWTERAREWVGAGFCYARTLRSRRLQAATVLPAMLAMETLDRLHSASWDDLQRRVKIPRARVYLALARAFMGQFP